MTQGEAVYVIIGAMAAVTYLTRIAGHALMQRFSRAAHPSPFMEGWMRALPGCILTAIVAPAVIEGGPADMLAAAVTLAVAVKSRNLFAAMAAGVAAAFLLRHLF